MAIDKTFLSFLTQLKEEIKQEVLEEIRVSGQVAVDRRLTIDEAVEYLRFSRETLYRLCEQKEIEHIRVGVVGSRRPRILFKQSTLDKWLADKEKESVAGASESP